MVLFKSINKLANPNTGGGRRVRLFIPPSTNYPLFSYGHGEDERSFLSLIENGSAYTNDEFSTHSDAASVSTSRSLPSTLSSVRNDDQESFHSWLVEEHQRLSSAANSDDDQVSTHSKHSHSVHSSVSSYNENEDFIHLKTNFGIESRMLFRYSLPLIITFVLEHFFSIVCLLVVGHLGKNELAAVSLGSMCSTVTFAIFEGIATALDTLCPQAYGARNYNLVSTHVQRCVVFSWLVFVPCGVAWWYSSWWLPFIVASEEVVELTVQFLRVMIIGAPAYIFFENFKRFLQAQGIFEGGTGVLFLSAPVNIGLSYFLVWNETYGVGFIGAAVSTVLNFWLMCFLLVAYVCFVDGLKCWYGFSSFSDLFSLWGRLLHLAVPGIVMLESEYLAYEIMTVFASYFGTTELAAQSAVASIASLTYMVPFAVSIASSTRIANFIGGQNITSAKIATSTGLMAAVLVSLVNFAILFCFKNYLALLFTKDEDVIKLIVQLFNPLVAVLQIFDGVASVASGILRAQGSQKIGGLINFLAYYALAMPLALVLTKFTDLKLIGLWLGVGSGMALIGLSETLVILTSDWESIIISAGLLTDQSFSEYDEE